MVYGEQKAREMARSLLPSKRRKAVRRTRASISRSDRRRSHVEMAQLARDPESFEDLAELDAESVGEILQMVYLRRDGDKLSPFIRWASAITRTLPQESRMSHIRSLVPRGVIGDHALQHLARERDFEHPNETAFWQAWRRAWARNRRPSWLDPGEQAELLRALLQAPGGHRAFNRWIRLSRAPLTSCPHGHACTRPRAVNAPAGPSRPRLLLGEHDVRPILAALRNAPHGPYAAQATIVDTFLRMFKECRGDVAATVRSLEFPRCKLCLGA